MKINWTLKPNETRKIQVDGKYLIVTKTAGRLEITAGGSIPVDMDVNERLHLVGDSPQDRAIIVKNISGGVNDIEIITSDLLIDKRTAADLANALVSIAQGERIGIDPNANIVQAIIQNSLQLAANQVIGIDPQLNQVTATLENAISINPAANTVRLDKADMLYQALDTINLDDDDEPIVIAGNENRCQLILAAAQNNEGNIWLSDTTGKGVPLYAGERITLNCNQAMAITGEEDDKLFVAEIATVTNTQGINP